MMERERKYNQISWGAAIIALLFICCAIYLFSIEFPILSMLTVANGFGFTEIAKHYDKKYRELKKERKDLEWAINNTEDLNQFDHE